MIHQAVRVGTQLISVTFYEESQQGAGLIQRSQQVVTGARRKFGQPGEQRLRHQFFLPARL